jgi:hypothetical protein
MSPRRDAHVCRRARSDGREGPLRPLYLVLGAVFSLVSHHFSAAC